MPTVTSRARPQVQSTRLIDSNEVMAGRRSCWNRLTTGIFPHNKGPCMSDDSTRHGVLFSDSASKPVPAQSDQDPASSGGDATLLQACDRPLDLTDALIGGSRDARQSGRIRQVIGSPVRQRSYAMACGYPDGNDAGRSGSDGNRTIATQTFSPEPVVCAAPPSDARPAAPRP